MFSFSQFAQHGRWTALLLVSGGAATLLTASPYDYAYGSMAHHDEQARERSIERMSSYSPNPRSSSGGVFDGLIADLKAQERRDEERRNAQRNAAPVNRGYDLAANFARYKQLHPEQFNQVAVDPDRQYFESVSRGAAAGSAEDMYRLGALYRTGSPAVSKNSAQAMIWLEKAGEAGELGAMTWAHFLHSGGEGGPVNQERALYWLRKEADAGDIAAQRDIGYRLFTADGVRLDQHAGLAYLEKAAAADDEYAIERLISIYGDLKSPARDVSRALVLLRRVLSKPPSYNFYNDADAFVALSFAAGASKQETKEQLVTVFKDVAPKSAKASLYLGYLFQDRHGFFEDPALASRYFEYAAALGKASAAEQLVSLYADKDSPVHDSAKALQRLSQLVADQPEEGYPRRIYLYRSLSAEAGIAPAAANEALKQLLERAVKAHPGAGYCLARLIEDSPTRTQEAARVVELYGKAAAEPASLCKAAAALRLYELYQAGDLVPADAARANKYLESAWSQDEDVLLYFAGLKLRDGIGVPADPVKAFFKFADRGYYDAPKSAVHELTRRAGLAILKDQLAHSQDPAALISMLKTVAFGSSEGEAAIWSAEEQIRVALRFPEYSADFSDARQVLEGALKTIDRPELYHLLALSETRILGPSDSAIEYAQKGADARDPGCENLLGLWRWEKSHGQDLSCVPLLEQAVSGGNADALFNLGRVYEVGGLAIRDEPKARSLYERASTVGIGAAKRQLAAMWADGRGGPQDRVKALALLREGTAEDRGALLLLGQVLLSGEWGERNAGAACDALKSALAKGEWRAGIELAWAYHTGGDMPPDDIAAQRALDEAAAHAQRDLFLYEARLQIGQAFWYGTCVAADPVKAMKLLETGPETIAAYRTGTGTEQSLNSAKTAARELEEQNDHRGAYELGEIALAQNHVADARQWFERAAQTGSIRGLQRLAECWAKGIGGPVDPKLAEAYQRAAHQLTQTETL